MNVRKQFIKPEIRIFCLDKDLMAVSGSEIPGMNLHPKVVDPGGQLAKPARAHFVFPMIVPIRQDGMTEVFSLYPSGVYTPST